MPEGCCREQQPPGTKKYPLEKFIWLILVISPNLGQIGPVVPKKSKLMNNLDKGLTSCAVFLDLAKALDSVSHEILLRKLHYYGVRGKAFELFKSYLSSRSQFVKLDGVKSSWLELNLVYPKAQF